MRNLLPAIALLLAASPAGAQDAVPAPADSARVYELAEVETTPRPVNLEELRAALDAGYPATQRQAGAGATVNLALVVGADGAVREPRVVSSTDSAFAEPSLGAIAVLRFTPGTVAGAPVATRVEIPLRWQVAAAAPAGDPASGIVRRVTRAADDTVTTHELSAVEEQPRPTNIRALRASLEQHYPPGLREERVRATVQVRFRVTPVGTVEAFTISRSTDPRFNRATIDALGVLRFTPAKVNGRPVYVWVELPIQWEVNQPDRRSRGQQDTGSWDPGAARRTPECGRTRC